MIFTVQDTVPKQCVLCVAGKFEFSKLNFENFNILFIFWSRQRPLLGLNPKLLDRIAGCLDFLRKSWAPLEKSECTSWPQEPPETFLQSI